MVTIYIDDKPYEAAAGQSLLSACLSLGFDVPYFCWHPALHSVGRMPAVRGKTLQGRERTRGAGSSCPA